MTMKAWGVIGLVVTTTIVLRAAILTLGPFGVPDGSLDLRNQPRPSPGRGAQAPMIIAPGAIDVEPSSHPPLLIEIGPPEWVPHDSTLQVRGLPSSVTLSQGRRVSGNLWAVPIAALSKVRIEVAADAAAGQSDVTLTLVGSDESYLAEARTALSINALEVVAANRPAKYTPAGIVSEREDPDTASPSETIELAPADHSTSGRKAPETLASSAERATPAAPGNPAESGRVAPPAQQESVVASPELAKTSIALNEAPELAAAKDGPTVPAEKSEEASARAVLENESAPADHSTSEPKAPETLVNSAGAERATPAAPSNPAESGGVAAPPAQLESVVASPELTKTSIALNEAAELAGAKGGPAMPVAKSEEESARPVPEKEIASQREVESVAADPAHKEVGQASKGPAALAQRETVVESRELVKASASALAQVAHASKCMTAGGWGTGAFESFASYMAESAMKNSAKSRFGDDVKISAIKKKCGQKGLLIECTASAQACR